MLLELEKRIRSKESSGLRSQHSFAAASSACFKNVKCCPHDTNQRKSISDLQHLDTYRNSMRFSNLLEPNWHRRSHNPARLQRQLNWSGRFIHNMSSVSDPFLRAFHNFLVLPSVSVQQMQHTTFSDPFSSCLFLF